MNSLSLTLEEIYRRYEVDPKIQKIREASANFVRGHGNTEANLMFIGEAPGFTEDKYGTPFMGKAGKVFDELLDGINVTREDVFVTNVFKYRPPKNRAPLPVEILPSVRYLNAEIKIIDPKLMILMGKTAATIYFPMMRNFEKTRGTFDSVVVAKTLRPAFVTYHPAASFHGSGTLEVLRQDFDRIKAALKNGPERFRGNME